MVTENAALLRNDSGRSRYLTWILSSVWMRMRSGFPRVSAPQLRCDSFVRAMPVNQVKSAKANGSAGAPDGALGDGAAGAAGAASLEVGTLVSATARPSEEHKMITTASLAMGGVTGRSSNVPGHGSNHRAGRCAPEVPGSSCPSPSPVANGWPTPGQFSAVTAWPVLSPQILWRRCRSDFSWKGSRPRELPAVIRLGERISRQAVAPRLCCEGQGSRSIHGLAERDHVAAFQPGPVDADGRGHAEILRRPQLAVRNLFRGLAVGPGKRRQEDEPGTRRALLGRGLLSRGLGFGRAHRRGLLLPDSFDHLLQARTAPGRQELRRRCDDPLRRSCLPAGLPEPREMRRHEGDHLELEAVRRSHRLGIALHLEQRSLELFCLPLDPRFLLALAGFQPPIAVAERER